MSCVDEPTRRPRGGPNLLKHRLTMRVLTQCKDCGATVTRACMSRHYKTLKHKELASKRVKFNKGEQFLTNLQMSVVVQEVEKLVAKILEPDPYGRDKTVAEKQALLLEFKNSAYGSAALQNRPGDVVPRADPTLFGSSSDPTH